MIGEVDYSKLSDEKLLDYLQIAAVKAAMAHEFRSVGDRQYHDYVSDIREIRIEILNRIKKNIKTQNV